MKGPKAQQTEQERALNEVSVAQWNDYTARYRPAEAELIKRAELTPGELASVEAQASADTATAFKGLTRDTIAANAVSGADASSGKTKFSLAANADARGRSKGFSMVAATLGAEDVAGKQMAGIAALGRNIAAGATEDLAAGARRASRVALAEAVGKYERNAALLEAGATIAGAATRKWGSDWLNQQPKIDPTKDTLSKWGDIDPTKSTLGIWGD